MGGGVIEIGSESEFSNAISAGKLSVVDFTAQWCGPCKMVAPRFEAMAAKHALVAFLKVDVDTLKNVAQKWEVRAMPTFMFFKNGLKIDEVVGANIDQVESLIAKHGGPAFPPSGGQTLGTAPKPSSLPSTISASAAKPSGDRATLIDMGFEEKRVDAALKATSNAGLQPAMDWLFAHQDQDIVDNSMSGVEATGGANTAEGNDDGITAEEATAQSLVCDDCGRILRDAAAAEFHAVKSGHQNFSESTQAIKPLTDEEKKIKLEQLKQRMAAKKEEKRLQEIEENKSKEKVRRTTGKEMVEMKEKMAELEMKKAAEAKKREKEEDRLARQKIKDQIELDKKERAARLEKEKLERQGIQTPAVVVAASVSAAVAASAAGPKEYPETRLQLRLPSGGPITQTFKSSEPLRVVYEFVSQQMGTPSSAFKLSTTFPRKVLDDQSKTLKELGLAPSAALVVS